MIGRLAKGGMAEAYLALSGELPGLRTVVVVKRILPHLAADDQFLRMFLDEARIGALLDHPNIPRIIEVGHDAQGYFIAMEAVPGKTLSAILRRAARRERPLGQADAAFIVARAAAALGYAHALTDADGRPLNIVHRDVSPENILVSFEGAVKVIDFGIASAHGRMSETLVGGLKGKVEYMSPEQASGAPVDRRSDVFSLGIILWEALSGRRLFRRETDLAVMRAISGERIPRPSGPRPIPPRLERIVMTALERAPEDRFQDAHEMAVQLERHVFRTDSFDPAQLVTQIKQLFPADHAGWKATMGMAQAVEGGGGHRKTTAAFPMLGGGSTHTGGPTVVLHEKPRSAAAATHVDIARMFPAESQTGGPEFDEGPALPRLTGWGGAQQEPGSDGGERVGGGDGDDAAAYARAAEVGFARTRLRGPGRCGCWSGRWPRRLCLRACAGGRPCRSRHLRSSTFATRQPSRGGIAAGGRAASVRPRDSPSPAAAPASTPAAACDRPARAHRVCPHGRARADGGDPRPRHRVPDRAARRRAAPPFGGPRLSPRASSRRPCASQRSRTARPPPPPRSPRPRVTTQMPPLGRPGWRDPFQ